MKVWGLKGEILLQEEERLFGAPHTVVGGWFVNGLSIPILVGDNPVGVINMSHPEKNFFNPIQVGVFNLLSLIVGILIQFAKQEAQLERKVRERTKELEHTKSYLEGILNNANDLILTIDRRGIITFINKKVEELGFKRDDLCGRFYSVVVRDLKLDGVRLRSLLKRGLALWEIKAL